VLQGACRPGLEGMQAQVAEIVAQAMEPAGRGQQQAQLCRKSICVNGMHTL